MAVIHSKRSTLRRLLLTWVVTLVSGSVTAPLLFALTRRLPGIDNIPLIDTLPEQMLAFLLIAAVCSLPAWSLMLFVYFRFRKKPSGGFILQAVHGIAALATLVVCMAADWELMPVILSAEVAYSLIGQLLLRFWVFPSPPPKS